ncbi:MAG: transporter [Candidatus Brocadiaceae bacterium]|nr:transporter [Candidatus Brocadiaceae bacterium]
MTERMWDGSRWWKFDFHTHTPASSDYGKGANQATLKKLAPKDWLLGYMREGIDCVVVTDHNSGVWIDQLKKSLAELKSELPENFRPMNLFPGVEISVNGGIHLLAIFGCNKTTSDVDSLLGAVGFTGTKGSGDAVTTKSFVEVADAIVSAGGIAIPAHVDEDNGIFRLQGNTLSQIFDCKQVFAMELVGESFQKPQLYIDKNLCWTEVLGSDAHHPSGDPGQKFPGIRFTWVKMGSPSIEGLQLALLDGSLSVLRSGDANPNEHASLLLESLEITNARYMGRPTPLCINLNPWLNTIIGGRGTGKSTLIEFLRLALRRDDELPDDLKPEFEKYRRVYPSREDGGLLTSDTVIKTIYRKNGTRFCIQWSCDGSLDAIQEEIGGEWQRTEGDIRQRFPVRMYSQKQIFQLAKTPHALLRIVDDAPEVKYHSWKEQWDVEKARFLSLRARSREIEAGLLEEPRLRGELDDVKRKLDIFEQAGHADVLKAFQRRRRQQQAVDLWEKSWNGVGDSLRQVAADIVPDVLEETAFDANSKEDAKLRECSAEALERMDVIRKKVHALSLAADQALNDWRKAKDESPWKSAVNAAASAYQDLQERLAKEGAGDPAAYGEFVQRRQTIEQRLENLVDRKKQIAELDRQAATSLKQLIEIRRKITESRKAFLEKVLRDNEYVRIQVIPYGAKETVEAEFRALLQREDDGFERDIGTPGGEGLLGDIYRNGSNAELVEQALANIKERVRKIALSQNDLSRVADQRFGKHVAKLNPEALDRLDLWFPEDSLDVQYSTTGERKSFRPIQEGSPGQKTAALLAFLLSYGEEPLILDQPEDDLDNHLIYDLIVAQLREVKRRRQIIVVTHNANVVVNGDSELVIALMVQGGQTQIERAGSLQDKGVRDTICCVVEGGRTAFEQRYRRIALEGRHV